MWNRKYSYHCAAGPAGRSDYYSGYRCLHLQKTTKVLFGLTALTSFFDYMFKNTYKQCSLQPSIYLQLFQVLLCRRGKRVQRQPITNGGINVEIGNPSYNMYEVDHDNHADAGSLLKPNFTLDPHKVCVGIFNTLNTRNLRSWWCIFINNNVVDPERTCFCSLL